MSHAFPPGDAEYVLRENVPIFHEVTQHDTKGELPYTSAVIDVIAAINNDRVNIGEPPVIAISHVSKTERPVVGFFGNFTTELRNGLKTIFATLAVYKDKAHLLAEFPRRSIEIIEEGEKKYVFNALALLGATEPALDLGVLTCSADRPKIGTFSMDNEQAAAAGAAGAAEFTVDPEREKEILHVLAKTDIFAWAHAQMKMAGDPDAQGEQEEMDAYEADKSADEKGEQGEEGQGAQKQDDSARESEGEEREQEKKAEKKTDDFSAVSSENESLKKQVRTMKRREQLFALEREGHVFSVDDELRDGEDLADEQFEKFIVGRIKKFTKQAPIHQKFSVSDVSSGGTMSGSVSEARIKRAQSYAAEHKCTFEQAYAKV